MSTWPTASLAKYDSDGRPGRAAAERVAMSVLDMTEPRLSRRAQTTYQRNMIERSRAEAERYFSWPLANWTVDGLLAAAHTFAWASAWGGFTVVNDVAVIVTATDVEMDTLRLRTLADTRSYHFDSREGLMFPESLRRAQELAGVSANEEWVPWPRHPDHEELLTAD